jgi:hypothetical protein
VTTPLGIQTEHHGHQETRYAMKRIWWITVKCCWNLKYGKMLQTLIL